MLLQAGGVQVLDLLMAHMPGQSSSTLLLSSVDDDSEHSGLWAAGEDAWVPALGMLSQVAKYSALGSQIILEVSAAVSLPLPKSAAQFLHCLFGLCVWLMLWACRCKRLYYNLLPAAPPVNNLLLNCCLVHCMQWLRMYA